MYPMSAMADLLRVAKHMKKIHVQPKQFLEWFITDDEREQVRAMMDDLNMTKTTNMRDNWWDEDQFEEEWV